MDDVSKEQIIGFFLIVIIILLAILLPGNMGEGEDMPADYLPDYGRLGN